MPRLEGVGTVAYNGVTFPSPLRAKAEVRPIYDDAGRMVKYRAYTLTVEAIFVGEDFAAIGAGGAIGPGMALLRQYLLEPGGTLTFTDQGLGHNLTALNIVDFGPKPRILTWEPIGSNRAARVVWSCEFTVVEYYGTGAYGEGKFGEFCWDAAWNIGEDGMQTRIVTGSADARVYRNGLNITNTADSLREEIKVPMLDGFKRTQQFRLSPDKRTLFFTITDTEIPSNNPYFPGMIDMDIRHRVAGLVAAAAEWDVSLSGSITVAPGVEKREAWKAFVQIVRAIKEEQDKGKQVGSGEPSSILITDRLEIEDEIFGRRISFFMNWKLLCNRETFLKASGLWKKMPGKWDTWRASLEDVVGPRGYAQLSHSARDDIIINFSVTGEPSRYRPRVRKPALRHEMGDLFKDPCPPKESSWLAFRNRIYVLSGIDAIRNRELGGAKQLPVLKANAFDNEGGKLINRFRGHTVIQHRGGAAFDLEMRGYARRLCYPITKDDIPTIGPAVIFPGMKDLVPILEEIVPSHKEDRTIGGHEVYRAAWRFQFLVPQGGTSYTVRNVPKKMKKSKKKGAKK